MGPADAKAYEVAAGELIQIEDIQGCQVSDFLAFHRDRAGFGICLDVWNVWQNADVAAAIKACGDRIFVVQVSDWRTPRSYEDRLVVGQGEIPWPPLLRTIHESSYRGPYTLEIFSRDVPDSLWQGDLSRVITDSRAGLEAAWREAFASP